MKNKCILLITFLISSFSLFSCGDSTKESTATYDLGLVEQKKITLPIDENTYYLSKMLFQYEEGDKECLFFGNFEKRCHEIIVYDIEQEDIYKRIKLEKEGPNGILAISGCRPFWNADLFIAFQHNIKRISIFDSDGTVLKHRS